MTTFRATFGLAAILLVTVSGCSAQSPTPSNEPAVVAPPTTSATASADPLVAPEQVAGGQCADLASVDELSVIAGGPVPQPRPFALDGSREVLIATVGGIHCNWSYFDGGSASDPSIIFDVFPVSVAPTDSSRACESVNRIVKCTFVETSDSFIVEGLLIGPLDAPEAQVAASVSALVTLISTRIADESPAERPQPSPESWPQRVDCASLASEIDLTPFAASGNMDVAQIAERAPFDSLNALYSRCEFGQAFQIETFSNGAWLETRVRDTDGATEIEVGGDVRAITVPATAGIYVAPEQLWVFSGPNASVLSSETLNPSDLAPLVNPVIEALDAQ